MVWCTQLRCQRLTLAAFGCQSITYVCSQRGLLDTGWQCGEPVTERMTTSDGLSALSLFSLLKHVPRLFLKLPSAGPPMQRRPPTSRNWSWSPMTRRRTTTRRTFTALDHPPPQRLSGDLATSPWIMQKTSARVLLDAVAISFSYCHQ